MEFCLRVVETFYFWDGDFKEFLREDFGRLTLYFKIYIDI